MQILFDHPWFLVVNKPTDLLTQAIEGIDSVQSLLTQKLQSDVPDGPTPFIGVPHRLDRVTTGVLVLARNQRALRRLCDQFASRKVTKTYHAIVHGEPEGMVREKWIDCIRKIPDVAKAERCDVGDEGGREAVLYATMLARGKIDSRLCPLAFQPDIGGTDAESTPLSVDHPASLLEVELETGRMHQIRLQCALRGYPVIGDALYGSRYTWESGEYRQPPIALHARSIEFHHPQTSERLRFEAPYPETWDRFHVDSADS